jgi:hypothetical protein
MELVRGRTLTAVLRERSTLPPQEVGTIGLALLVALEVAHTAGVLHRDVKPGNVLIGDDGRIALTDFGIATVDGDGGDPTTTGVIVGSPAYVAPERVHGEPSTPAADLWSLGATLWTAAEGRPPYQGDTAIAVMSSVAMTDAPPCSRCTGPLADLLGRMLDRDPAGRPDAATVRAELARVATDPDASVAPTEPYPTEPLPVAFDRTTVLDNVTGAHERRDAPPARRSRLPIAGALGAVLLLAVVAALLLARPDSGGDPGPADRRADKPAPSGTSTLPEGWTRYRDPEIGWSVGVPAGWQRSATAEGTRFTDPAGGRYLLVATRYPAGSSAVGAWHESERAFRSAHQGYQRLRLERIDVAGARDAADWEFVYDEGGARLHAIDRAMVVGDRGYALYFQTHDDRWDESQRLFEQIDASFDVS